MKDLARILLVIVSTMQKAMAKSENSLHVGKGSDPDFAVTRGSESKFIRQLRVLRTKSTSGPKGVRSGFRGY